MKKPNFDWVKRLDGTSEFAEYLDSIPDEDMVQLLGTIEKTETEGLMIAQR